MSEVIFAGLGFGDQASVEDLLGALTAASTSAGMASTAIRALAVPSFKRYSPPLAGLIAILPLPLILVPDHALQAVAALCPNPSAVVLAATGLAAIAEAAALAAAGARPRLIVPKTKYGRATCALAAAGIDP